jgi:hypothetical protein
MSQINTVDDLIRAIEDQHLKANQNKFDSKRRNIQMICLKVNPPFLGGPGNYEIRRNQPNVLALIIPKIKCYYNLHINSQFELKTSIYPFDFPYVHRVFDLHERPFVNQTKLAFFGTQGNAPDQIVKEKFVNIEKNCDYYHFDIFGWLDSRESTFKV